MDKTQPRETYLYIIYNTINGKMYVGITVNPKRRWYEHKKHARHMACKSCYAINFAMRKYGIDNFIFRIIEDSPSWEDSCKREIEWIKTLKENSYQIYNETEGGEGHLGQFGPKNLTPEQRKKLSDRMSGKNNYFYGKKLSGSANGHYGHKMLPHVKEILLKKHCKLTKDQVRDIRAAYANKSMTQTELSVKYNIHLVTVHNIINGQSWNNGTIPVRQQKPQLKPENVLNIRSLYASGNYTLEKLGKEFGISISQVSRIINRKKWNNI